jgi:ATP-binding cassette subfamily F protein uup
VGDGRDYVTLNGKQQHVVGYLTGFLFSAKRAMTPVAALSGGERNRVILAKLFTQPTNLLVLDEPTNDLDVETLEVLEQRLAEYNGTLIVVSHDREFLDNVVTSILVFEAGGQIREYAGGYSDWVRRGRELEEIDDPNRSGDGGKNKPARRDTGTAPAKLSYKLQRELDALPDRIEALERQVAELQSRIAAPGFYAQSFEQTQPVLEALTARTGELDTATERWLELEERQQAHLAGKADSRA